MENKYYSHIVYYHLTQTDVQLFSPQTSHYMHGGYSEVHDWWVSMYLIDDLIIIHISREQTNIPIVYNSFVS